MVRASDRHAADAGSIPLVRQGIFLLDLTFSSDSLTVSVQPLCAIGCTYICVHVKDPVVRVRVRWIMKTLTHPACTVGWVARLYRSWLSPGEGNPNFPWEKSHWENVVVKSKKIKLKKYYDPGVQYGITDNYDPYNSELYITVTCAI